MKCTRVTALWDLGLHLSTSLLYICAIRSDSTCKHASLLSFCIGISLSHAQPYKCIILSTRLGKKTPLLTLSSFTLNSYRRMKAFIPFTSTLMKAAKKLNELFDEVWHRRLLLYFKAILWFIDRLSRLHDTKWAI